MGKFSPKNLITDLDELKHTDSKNEKKKFEKKNFFFELIIIATALLEWTVGILEVLQSLRFLYNKVKSKICRLV